MSKKSKNGARKRRLTIEQIKLMPRTVQLEIFRQLTSPVAHMELPVGDELLEKKKSARFNSPVCISIHSIRKRLADPDGISGKAAIDGLVKARILEDDSTSFVKEVKFTQSKTEHGEEESTTITITN